MYDLHCIYSSRTGTDDKFSSYLLATRGDDLNEVCKQVANFEELERVQLVHQKGPGFTVESGVRPPDRRRGVLSRLPSMSTSIS